MFTIDPDITTPELYNMFYNDFVLLGTQIIEGPEVDFNEHELTAMLAVFQEIGRRAKIDLDQVPLPEPVRIN